MSVRSLKLVFSDTLDTVDTVDTRARPVVDISSRLSRSMDR